MTSLSRRHFLKAILGASIALAVPHIPSALAFDMPATVPPSVMLHSRHWRVLPDLLTNLRDLGYNGITYIEWEQALLGNVSLPPQPVILSVDDLSCEIGNPAFRYFKRMKNDFVENGFKAVFGIITRPNLKHDPDRWTEVASWVDEGIELATHTSYHSNLDNPKFTGDDYQVEIADSAVMITEKTDQVVRSLITPYGSGYDVEHQTLNPHVLAACRTANLRFMVGITTGQRHVHVDTEAGDVIYTGRANPGNEYPVNDTLYYVKYW